MLSGTTVQSTTGKRLAVYSCHFGAHEPFNPGATAAESPYYDRFVFTDHASLPTTARLVNLPDPGHGPAILSRLPKLCPHLFFQGYDWVIYLDNNARFLISPDRILRRVQREHPDAPPGRYLFRHRRRDCAWAEAAECRRLGYMTDAQLARIEAEFATAGLPRHAGLFVNTCLVQRMGSAQTDALNEAWFASLTSHTRRDQVMLPLLLRRMATPHRVLAAKVKDWADWPVFSPQMRERFRRNHARSAA